MLTLWLTIGSVLAGPAGPGSAVDDGGAPTRPDAPEPAPVVGGTDAEPGRWPDAVALYTVNGVFGCTGTLIAPDLVLTAGHCGFGFTRAVLDTDDHAEGGESIDIVESFVHEDYFTTFDVAVYVLAEPSSVPPRPIARDCLAADYLHDGAEVAIVGFGATDEWANDWTTLKQEAWTTVTDHDCSELTAGCNAAVSPAGEVIAGGDGVDSCNGDSGGPLYLATPEGDFLAGVTSRAAVPSPTPCGGGGIYVRADAIADWVEAQTGTLLARPDCEGFNRAPHPTAEPIEVAPGSTGFTQILPLDPNPADSHRFEWIGGGDKGRVLLDDDGVLAYTPNPGQAGADSVLVRVVDDGVPEEAAELEIPVWVLTGEAGRQVEPRRTTTCAAGGDAPTPSLLGLLRRR